MSRMKLLLRVLLGLAVLIVVLVSVWCWLVFRPTGLNALRVEQNRDFSEAMKKGDGHFLAVAAGPPAAAQAEARLWSNDEGAVRLEVKRRLLRADYGYGVRTMIVNDEISWEREVQSSIAEVRQQRSIAERQRTPSEIAEEDFRRELHSILDLTEEIYLPDQRVYGSGSRALVQWCVLRAVFEGEHEKAATLTRLYCEGLSADTEFLFTSRSSVSDVPAASLVGWGVPLAGLLTRQPEVPDELLLELDSILRSVQIIPEQADVIYHDAILNSLTPLPRSFDPVDFRRGDTSWDYFLDGKPLAIWRSILSPVAKNESERLLVAWIKEDPDAVLVAMRSLKDTTSMMNLPRRSFDRYGLIGGVDPDDELAAKKIAWVMGMRKPARPNLQARLGRFVIACGRFHRDEGRWPAEVNELVPKYLEREFTSGDDGNTWHCIDFDQGPAFVAIRPAGPYHESYFQQIFANEDPANVKGLLEHLLAGEDTSREWLATCLEVADPVLIELLRERPAEE